MGAIAGAYQQVDGASIASAMSERLAHRGPNGEGSYAYLDSRVRIDLSHRRLSVVGPPGGGQPLTRHGLTLSYDGELYNHVELRDQLAKRGVWFRAGGDTEVVLEAWREWGPGCLRRFRGIFALAVFCESSGSLFLARDQMGVKPLHFLPRDGGVVFASELKAFTRALGHELDVDPGALVASILYYWVPEGRCTMRGVEKVQPGTWIEFRPDGVSRRQRYWDPSDVASAAAAGPPMDLRDTVQRSVIARLDADAPIGAFLSGGLDSSLVSVIAKRELGDLDVYTVTFRPQDQRLEAVPNDAVFARRVARQFRLRLRELRIEPDVVDLLPRLVEILDEPIGDPAALNTLLMCQAARHAGTKVMLSGIGADELFAGHHKHVACALAARYQQLPDRVRDLASFLVGSLPVAAGGRGLRYSRWAKQFLTFSELPEEAAFRRSYTLYDPIELAALVSGDLGPEVDEVMGEHLELYCDNRLADQVNRMCLADARHFLPGLNLTYTDRASMACSVQIRLPFVDPIVFRAAFSVPGNQKVRGRQSKVALRAAARPWLPREILHRPKTAFSAPLRAWIANDLDEMIDDVLIGGELVSSGFLRRDAVLRLVADERSRREDRSKQIWQLLTLEVWYQQHRTAAVSL
jgi:asparagine synthase (glutamine-hydrolysing)